MRMLALAILGAVLFTTAGTAHAASAAVGQAAPAFTLTDATGAQVSLADHAGSVVVLEWVNFDCPFVKKHYRSGNMQALQQRYAAQGVVWLAVCSSAPGKQGHFAGDALTSRIASEQFAGAHYLIDADGATGRAYGALTTPHMYVIDAAGNLAYHGAIDSVRSANPADIPSATNHVAEALDAVIAGNAVPTPATRAYGCSVKYP